MGDRQRSSPSMSGLASLGAAAVAASLAGAHATHRSAFVALIVAATLHLACAALLLLRPTRPVTRITAVTSAVLACGWLLTATIGVPATPALDATPAYPALLAAALAAASAVLPLTVDPGKGWALGGAGVLTAVLVVPAMVVADGADHTDEAPPAEDHETAVATRPFDPALPIDLGGVPGVTPEQQARAENLLSVTLLRLPQFASTETAYAAGYRSIGDSITGEEHYINWSLRDDDRILDPDHPEALVYKVGPGDERTLEAAMFMLPPGSTWDDVPDIGGPLTQWHIHNDLCLTDDPEPKVASITGPEGDCPDDLIKITPVPMIHVWITPNACGPFAALRGVGAGQIEEGETRLCDLAHGDH